MSFEDFWKIFPRRMAKFHARTAWDKAIKHSNSAEIIIEGAKRYAAWLAQVGPGRWRPHPKHPATWLNGGCWLDEYSDKPVCPATSPTSDFLARWEANSKKLLDERDAMKRN